MTQRKPLPDLRETQKRFLEELALIRRPGTVIDSRSSTNVFIAYLESAHPELGSFANLERRHLEGWFHHLASKGYTRGTHRNRIIKVRCFLEAIQIWEWEEAPRSPLFRRGDLPAEDRYLPRPLAPQTDRALWEELRREGGFISKALLLLRATGLRSQELLDLGIDALSELSQGGWSLRVPLGKLHTEREIPVDSETAKLFGELVELRGSPPPAAEERTGKPTHFLLMRADGRRYSREALRYYLARAEKKALLAEHPTPHRLRHTCATELLRAGMALPALMKFLGHRSIGMTLRYAQVTGIDVRNAYNESLLVLKERYDLGALRPRGRQADEPSNTRRSILDRIDAATSALESYRRDHVAKPAANKRVRRLVERLRRLSTDIAAATS